MLQLTGRRQALNLCLPCLSLVIGVLLTSANSVSARGWGTTRKNLIAPLHSTLHSHYPMMLAARELDHVVGFYETPTGTGISWQSEPESTEGDERTLRWRAAGSEPIRERYRKLLELFEEIERADLRMDRVDWKHPTDLGYSAQVRLLVSGTGGGGDRRHLEQHATLRIRKDEESGNWLITQEEVTARTLAIRASARFTWEADAVGIANRHANALSPPFRLFGGSEEFAVRQASGVAVADVDRDGCEDLLLGGSPALRLYRGRCDGSFEDVTDASGLPRSYPAAASGVVFFDYDNDGWPDLFVGAVRGGSRLFHNVGDGRFEDATIAAALPKAEWTSAVVVADYNRDGFLDVYLAGMGDHESAVPEPNYDARNGYPGMLLRNDGDGTFSDVTEKAGVGSRGWDLSAAWADYDDDGWPDLYVANEFGNNILYRNEHDGTFSDRTRESGTQDGGAGMGVAWGDIDGDGDQDLFVSGMHANTAWAMFHPSFPAPVPWHLRLLGFFTAEVERRKDLYIDRLTRGNSLFRNEGDGTFSDISDSAGVRDGQWAWGAQFLDYDNDGRLDLYAVNGFVSGPVLDDV